MLLRLVWNVLNDGWILGLGISILFALMVPFIAALFRRVCRSTPRFLWRLNRAWGRIDYVITPIRDLFFIGLIAVFSLKGCVALFAHQNSHALPGLESIVWLIAAGVGSVGYAFLRHRQRRLVRAALLRLEQNPSIHPKDYFDALVHTYGPFPLSETQLDETYTQTVSPAFVSCVKKTSAHRVGIRFIVGALIDTLWLARASLYALRVEDTRVARAQFDRLAALWGKRVLFLMGGELRLVNGERLNALSGQIVLVMNHLSQLDFILLFFALSDVRLKDGRALSPRFIVAKDHFKDNPLIYHVLGVGKAIEAVGMIFLERKKRDREKTEATLRHAADLAVRDTLDIAIFPQGTRVPISCDADGTRYEMGYTTTYPRREPLKRHGYLRNGVVLVVNHLGRALQTLGRETPIHIVPVGLVGTGCAMSPGEYSPMVGSRMEVRVGEVMTFSPREASVASTETVIPSLDARLQTVLEYPRLVLERFSRGRQDSSTILHVFSRMSDEEKARVVVALDRVYALPCEVREPWLCEFETLVQTYGAILACEFLAACDRFILRVHEMWGKK